jgi:hypothetical protein
MAIAPSRAGRQIPAKDKEETKMDYSGIEIVYSPDDRGYYATKWDQEGKNIGSSRIYKTKKAILKAIETGKIKFN